MKSLYQGLEIGGREANAGWFESQIPLTSSSPKFFCLGSYEKTNLVFLLPYVV